MLRGISPLLSPELLAVLSRMGHGDELVLADVHFPAESVNSRVLRADACPRAGQRQRSAGPERPACAANR